MLRDILTGTIGPRPDSNRGTQWILIPRILREHPRGISLGAHTHKNRFMEDVGRFLASIMFEQLEKLEELGVNM